MNRYLERAHRLHDFLLKCSNSHTGHVNTLRAVSMLPNDNFTCDFKGEGSVV